MNTQMITLGLLALFGVASVVAEIVRAKTQPPEAAWISTYLQGPGSWIECLAFVALGAALELMPHVLNLPRLPTILFTIGGVAMIMLILTRQGPLVKYISSWHVPAAGVAFLSTAIALGIISSFQLTLALAASAAICAFLYLDKGIKYGHQYAEKFGAAAITAIAFLDVLKG